MKIIKKFIRERERVSPAERRPLPGVVSYWRAGSSLWILELAILAAAIARLARERVSGPLRRPLRA